MGGDSPSHIWPPHTSYTTSAWPLRRSKKSQGSLPKASGCVGSGLFSPWWGDEHHLSHFTATLGAQGATRDWTVLWKTITWAQHTHLRDGGWLPCRSNAPSGLSWVIGTFPLDRENLEAVLLASEPPSMAGLSLESSPHLPLPLGGSPLPGRWGGLPGEVPRPSLASSLSGPRGLLEVGAVLEAGPSGGAGQLGVWTEGSGSCGLPSLWGWAALLKAGDRLSERLRRESWKGQGQKQRWGSPWREVGNNLLQDYDAPSPGNVFSVLNSFS